MFFKILKKDIQKRKGVNCILFLFMILATIFLASSVYNILTIMSATDYFFDYANVPDVVMYSTGTKEENEIEDWLDSEKDLVADYETQHVLLTDKKNISLVKDGEKTSYETNNDVYLSVANMKYAKPFDEDGNELELQNGEIALGTTVADRLGLEKGDKVVIKIGNTEKEFVLKAVAKDAIWGKDMCGMERLLLTEDDYNAFREEETSVEYAAYSVMIEDVNEFNKECSKENFTEIANRIGRSTFEMIYVFDMIFAAILIVVGVVLILISMLVLRFTIVFTIEENYREIGLMKAIGIRDISIKSIYLVKYLAIVTVGAVLGGIISVPVEKQLIQSVSRNMIMENSSKALGSNFVCVVVVIGIVMAFCYFCTRKLKKYSAVETIRNGSTAERFAKKSIYHLHRSKHSVVPVYLAVNDIMSNLKRYLVLLCTFIMGFLLIMIPINTINTMRSSEMASKFTIDPHADVIAENITGNEEEVAQELTQAKFRDEIEKLEETLKNAGYGKVKIGTQFIYFLPVYSTDKDAKESILMTLAYEMDDSSFSYVEGTAPVLENEIGVSVMLMEQWNWQIGDTIHVMVGEDSYDCIITGTYSDYMQMGKSMRLSPAFEAVKDKNLATEWYCSVHLDSDLEGEALVQELEDKFPDYEWMTVQHVVDENVGNIQGMLSQARVWMVILICAVLMMITILMEKLFICREKGEIAMLKSIGFSNGTICLWQISRMVGVVVLAAVFAIPLSGLCDRYVLAPVFEIMGAQVKIQVEPLQVYGIYPGILLIAIIIAAWIATFSIRKIDIREMNNCE